MLVAVCVASETQASSPPAEYDSDAAVVFAGTPLGQDLDPYKAGGTTIGIVDLYDTLIEPTPDLQFAPGLAESWEYSEDGLTLTLHLRQGVSFHDGTPFDSAAVVASLNRARTGETSQQVGAYANVSDVVAVDEFTVDVVLSTPDPTLPATMASLGGAIINPNFIDDEDAILNGSLGVGTGPYTVVSFTPTTTILLERNDDYWNPEAIDGAPRTFQFDVADGNARLNGLLTDVYQGIQWVGTPGLGGDGGVVATDDRFEQNTTLSSVMFGLGFNFTSEPLADPRVRMALAEGIDIDTLIDTLLKDEMSCSAPRPSQLPLDGQLGYDETIQPIPYDPEAAAALLAEAGYPDGEGIPELQISSTEASNDVVAAEAFVQMWADLGIEVSVDPQPSRVFAWTEFQAGNSQLITTNLTVGGNIDPAGAVDGGILPLPLVDESEAGQQYRDLAAQAKATLDNDERAALYSQMSHLVNDNAFFVPICRGQTGYGTTVGIDGIENSWWLTNGIVEASAIRVQK